MKKNYILDTNVLVHDPNCLEKFEDNVILIPLIVLEEIDGLKKSHGSI
jgi:PhoH-like ATPase